MTERNINIIPKKLRPAVYSLVALGGLAAAACGGAKAETENGDIPTQPAATATIEAPTATPDTSITIYGLKIDKSQLPSDWDMRAPAEIGTNPLPADAKEMLDRLIKENKVNILDNRVFFTLARLEAGNPFDRFNGRRSIVSMIAGYCLSVPTGQERESCRKDAIEWKRLATRDYPDFMNEGDRPDPSTGVNAWDTTFQNR